MPFDGSGNYSPPGPPTFPAVSGQPISSAYFNALINDIANNGLSKCLTVDGQSTVTGPIPFNGQDITGVDTLSADGFVVNNDSAIGGIANGGYRLTLNHATDVREALSVAGNITGFLQATAALVNLGTAGGIPLNLSTGGSPRISIASNGRVTIPQATAFGDATPLDLGAILTLGAATDTRLGFALSGVADTLLQNTATTFAISAIAAKSLTFRTTNTLRMTIASTGEVSTAGAFTSGGALTAPTLAVAGLSSLQAVTVSTTLGVTGAATFASSLGALSLAVTNNVTAGGTLNVVGAITQNGSQVWTAANLPVTSWAQTFLGRATAILGANDLGAIRLTNFSVSAGTFSFTFTNGTNTIILQGGTGSIGANTDTTISFPTAFVGGASCTVSGGSTGGGSAGDVHTRAATGLTTQAISNTTGITVTYTWIAIGGG